MRYCRAWKLLYYFSKGNFGKAIDVTLTGSHGSGGFFLLAAIPALFQYGLIYLKNLSLTLVSVKETHNAVHPFYRLESSISEH